MSSMTESTVTESSLMQGGVSFAKPDLFPAILVDQANGTFLPNGGGVIGFNSAGVRVTFQVWNIGGGAAKSFHFAGQVRDSNGLIVKNIDHSLHGLGAGHKWSVEFVVGSSKPGQHVYTCRARVDDLDEVVEADESNNQTTFAFTLNVIFLPPPPRPAGPGSTGPEE